MSIKPKCIIVTGRPGAGKATLCKKLQPRLWMPVVSRDEIKEGYVNTFGVKHDKLPPDANGIATNIFFDIVDQYLSNEISIIVEAAFQHGVWEHRLPKISRLADPFMIVCDVDTETAANRHLQRGLAEPEREYYHGDKRVVVYRETGEILPAGNYETPDLDIPTLNVATIGEYSPTIDEIVKKIRSNNPMEEIRQAQMLTDEEKRLLYEWGENIFGVEAHKLRWRPKDLHFLLYSNGKPLSHVGILKHVISLNGASATVAGVGGVVTVPEAQQKGHANLLMRHAASFFESEWNVDAGLLFCRPELLEYYEALGWQEFDGPVMIQQPTGDILSPLRVMILPLKIEPLTPGQINLQSLPW